MTLETTDNGKPRLVEMGSLAVARPPGVLEIRGLGSCVAIALHDPDRQVAGLAHAVIPRPLDRHTRGPAWATTEAVPRLLDAVREAGADPARLQADLAGGASMFAATLKGFNVGEENTRAAETALAEAGIPLRSRHVGGVTSRAIRLDPRTGAFEVEGRPTAPRARPPLPARGRREPAGVRDGRELASILLHRAVSPLSTLTGCPVNVDGPEAYELTLSELAEFLGGVATGIHGSFVTLRDGDWTGHLAVLLPTAHARRLGDALRPLSDEPVTEGEVLDEVLHIVTSHAVTALAGILRARLLPEEPTTVEGPVRRILRAIGERTDDTQPVLTVHGRAYAESLFHGADVALLLLGAPARLEPAL